MPRLPIPALLLAAALLAACGDAPSEATPPAAGAAAEAGADASADANGIPPLPDGIADATAPTEAGDLGALPFAAALANGSPYSEARDAVLGAGWRPIVTPACAENVGGEARVCRELPELEACSGTGEGLCRMAFADPTGAQTLTLRTKGGHADWSVRGEAASMRVDGAELATVAAAPGAACPSGDFDAFLAAFAADPAVRAAWTAPLVRTALRYDLGEDSIVVEGAVRAGDFTGFPVTHRGSAFHFVDAAGQVDPAPLALDIAEDGADSRRVSFAYGMSEGNSVRFVRTGDCWQLAEDPEPPAS